MKVLYEWIEQMYGEGMPTLEAFEQLFTFHAFEIDGIETVHERGPVIDIKVLPDRAPDCLSHRGIARELATLSPQKKRMLEDPFTLPCVLEPKTEKIKVTIAQEENCHRFTAALISGITVGPSPEWLKKRLEALGQRSINNIVDATNYVMFELGQPLHAYDADALPHNETRWHIRVRMARDGETITTLGGGAYTLTPSVQLITCMPDDVPVGIAGIKGGIYAEVGTKTKTILLEAAHFDAAVTRKAAQILKLQTDASKRFENNLSPYVSGYGLSLCVKLITEIAGGVCEGYSDTFPHPPKNPTIPVPHAHIESLLGVTIAPLQIEDIFDRLDFSYTKNASGWEVTAPFWRRDVLITEDVIAEIGRVYGYDHVTSVVPISVPLGEINARHYWSERLRALLCAEGFSEVITSSFRKKDTIELANALASDKGCLRSSLRENVREVLDRNMPNADLLGLRQVQVFEIGTVFAKGSDQDVLEHISLALGVRSKQTGPSPKDDVRLGEVQAKLEDTLGIPIHADIRQGVLECNFSSIVNMLPKPVAYEPFEPREDTTFLPYSQYPFIARDIALWVPESTSEKDVEALIRSEAGPLLVRLALFDTFAKDGKVSYAFRLVFQSFERTLTDTEVGEVMEKVTQALQEQGYTVR